MPYLYVAYLCEAPPERVHENSGF